MHVPSLSWLGHGCTAMHRLRRTDPIVVVVVVVFIVLAWTCCCCRLTMLVWMQCHRRRGLAMRITSHLHKVDVDALSASYRGSIFHAHFVAIVAASSMVAVDGP